MNRNPNFRKRPPARPAKKPEITMVEYIVMTRRPQARQLIVSKFGLTPARNDNELIQKLYYIIKHHKEAALKELTDIHPDKDLILDLQGGNAGAIGKAGGDDEYSYQNFITNYRNDIHDFNAAGTDGVNKKAETPGKKVDQGLILAGIVSLAIVGMVLMKGK